MLYITSMFQDSVSTEKTVLDFLYSKTPPTTLSREWFPIEYKDLILETLEKMENLYLNSSEEILEDCTK